jgi:hypothetical protein
MKKKQILIIGFGVFVVALIWGLAFTKQPLSPPVAISEQVGKTTVSIHYSAPSVRERKIWGGLLPMNVLWRAGANSATSFTFDKAVMIRGNRIEAGKYAFFVIPRENEWTLIINRKWDQFGTSNYDPQDDILRFNVRPEDLDQPIERLVYEVSPSGEVSLAWEKKKVGFRIEEIEHN